MRAHRHLTLLLVMAFLLTACGIKSDPKPPKPKPSGHISFLRATTLGD